MPKRSRTPTGDDDPTRVFAGPRGAAASAKGTPAGPADPALATPTTVEPLPPPPSQASQASQPLRVISRKSPDIDTGPVPRAPVVPREVKLRQLADVRPVAPVLPMGNLAPPRDRREARSRHVRANLWWSVVAVLVAAIVGLIVWFLAR